MTKEKALYQAKLIIDNLSDEEYSLIPKDFIDYINENMEYDESITINPDIPLEEQDIDDKTYDILEEMLNKIDKSAISKLEEGEEVVEGTKEFEDLKNENMKLKKLAETLQLENSKIAKIKELVQDYKDELSKKSNELEDLKAQNEALYNSIKKCPKLIRKIYFKEFESKLLK
jgi:hypothetical protein